MSLYGILGVSPDAPLSFIRKQWKKLALQYHPDKTNGDKFKENKFVQITKAYHVLSDPSKVR